MHAIYKYLYICWFVFQAVLNVNIFYTVNKHRPFLTSTVDEKNNYINAVFVGVSMDITISSSFFIILLTESDCD